jgi:hypothetical protein
LPTLTTTFLLPILLASAPDAASAPRAKTAGAGAFAGRQLAQVTIEQRVIIRIPTVRTGPQRSSAMRAEAAPAPPSIRWKETKGPKCIPLNGLRGAVINMLDGITMVTGRNEQYRTHFGRACRAADFYSGFYIQPNEDGAICAGRDTLHARNGSACEIEKFSRMVPEVAPPEKPRKPERAEP